MNKPKEAAFWIASALALVAVGWCYAGPAALLFWLGGLAQALQEEYNHYKSRSFWQSKSGPFARWMRRDPATTRTWYDHSAWYAFVFDLVNDGYHTMKTLHVLLPLFGAYAFAGPWWALLPTVWLLMGHAFFAFYKRGLIGEGRSLSEGWL